MPKIERNGRTYSYCRAFQTMVPGLRRLVYKCDTNPAAMYVVNEKDGVLSDMDWYAEGEKYLQ